METTVTFIATEPLREDLEDHTISYLINDRCLLDCAWNVATNMRRIGHSPRDLDAIFITHGHTDHYIGLLGVLYLNSVFGRDEELTIFGPQEDIERIVADALTFLQSSLGQVLRVVPLGPGEEFEIGEFTVRTARAHHRVPALCYRFRDNRTGKQIGFSGDTAYAPRLAEFFAGVDLLVYEAGRGLVDPEVTPQENHSGVRQTARIAREVGPERLYLVHAPPGNRDEILAAGREIFPETYWPKPGQRVVV